MLFSYTFIQSFVKGGVGENTLAPNTKKALAATVKWNNVTSISLKCSVLSHFWITFAILIDVVHYITTSVSSQNVPILFLNHKKQLFLCSYSLLLFDYNTASFASFFFSCTLFFLCSIKKVLFVLFSRFQMASFTNKRILFSSPTTKHLCLCAFFRSWKWHYSVVWKTYVMPPVVRCLLEYTAEMNQQSGLSFLYIPGQAFMIITLSWPVFVVVL